MMEIANIGLREHQLMEFWNIQILWKEIGQVYQKIILILRDAILVFFN